MRDNAVPHALYEVVASAIGDRLSLRMRTAYLTTSWDDGHPLDVRLAELLHKYGIPGTFYVPQSHVLPVMGPSAIRRLASEYEIGGHTLNHADLLRVDDVTARAEIVGCRVALQDITGTPCRCFCFPGGHFRRWHVACAREAGFTAVRTVELMSTGVPRQSGGVSIMPTSILAYSLPCAAIVRNIVKRHAVANAANLLRCRRQHWTRMAEALLDRVASEGGVFHLWGHSWEIDKSCAWKEVEAVFAAIAQRKELFTMASNGDLCGLLRTSGGRAEVSPCP